MASAEPLMSMSETVLTKRRVHPPVISSSFSIVTGTGNWQWPDITAARGTSIGRSVVQA